jgi:rfaE bifunctional protein kinase chain/domain/rfaE bifunctional protein nucleotidyltransferase chain/domain
MIEYNFFEKFKHKIIEVKELKKKLKKSKKITLCHGVFDVVHPGHLRHLIYAKSKSNLLVVSITSDKFINKGIYRPHVPENLRAINLAAFEIVDYVVIDRNKTPINLLKYLKPNLFAKGFEYSDSLPKETTEEKNIVESYGGEMLFTPGDVVYSSSNLLSNHSPSIGYEKLSHIMNKSKITFDDLKNTLLNFKKLKVHVIGDTIIDTYTRTSLLGNQAKTPTFSCAYENHEDYVGGAGIVAKHLKKAGAEVTFTTVTGEDSYKKLLVNEMKKNKIKLNLIVDKNRPTTNKNTIIADKYRLLRINTLDNRSIDKAILTKITNFTKKTKADSVILSDFRHGIYNKDTIPIIVKSIDRSIFRAADSQVANRWGNICDFKNFDLITPNEKESRFALADQDSTVNSLSHSLSDISKAKNIIMKLGEKGVFSISNIKNKRDFFSLDSFTNKVADPVGAGDALLAYSTLSMLCSKSLVIATIIGSIAAALECEIDGNIPVDKNDIIKKIEDIEKHKRIN